MQRQPQRTSPSDYLAFEERSPTKHEYVDAEIYAMTGASRRHNLLASNLVAHAWNAAAAHEACQVFGSDMKVYVAARNSFYYPDVSGCCDSEDRDERYLTRPCFIVEVSSPSTASIDRREKRSSYSTLGSLREYVIVDQDRMRVAVYSRAGDGWVSQALNEAADVLEISCIGLTLTLERLYERVELPPQEIAEPEAPDYVV